MIKTITIQPPNGVNYAYAPEIAFVKPIAVSNETAVYSIGTAAAGTICKHDSSGGKIDFENNFDGTQRVFIIYKT